MNIDNSISRNRIKKALPLKTVVAVLLIVSVLSVIFYVTLQNREKRQILIWHVTTDSEKVFSDDLLESINDYGTENGINRVVLTKRHPEDTYFHALMTVSGFYTCDIFIMQKDIAEKYSDMFMPLPDELTGSREVISVDNKDVGVLLYEDYYLLVNVNTDVEVQVICGIFNMLIENK